MGAAERTHRTLQATVRALFFRDFLARVRRDVLADSLVSVDARRLASVVFLARRSRFFVAVANLSSA